MSDYFTWPDVIAKLATANIHIQRSQPVTGTLHNGLKLCDQSLPISIAELEFNFMRDLIVKHQFKSIYELSTGLGISTLALSLGAKETNGKVMSFDSYAEEETQAQPVQSTVHTKYAYRNTQCYRTASIAAKIFEVEPFVDLRCGWSPVDTIPALAEFTNRHGKLDFVFFDCPKCDSDFERDLTSIVPFLADRYTICIHDTHTYTDEASKTAIRLLGIPYHHILTKSQTYPLAMLTNFDDVELYRNL